MNDRTDISVDRVRLDLAFCVGFQRKSDMIFESLRHFGVCVSDFLDVVLKLLHESFDESPYFSDLNRRKFEFLEGDFVVFQTHFLSVDVLGSTRSDRGHILQNVPFEAQHPVFWPGLLNRLRCENKGQQFALLYVIFLFYFVLF